MPDHGTHPLPGDRRALRAVAVQFFVNGAIVGSIVARYPELRHQVGIDLAQLGLILTFAGGAGLVGSVITSPLVQRFTTRRTMIVGAIIQTALLAAVGVTTSAWLLALILGVISIVDVVVDVSMNLQGSWISSRRRIPVMNRLHGLWSLGTLLGGLAAARLAAAGVSLRVHLAGATAILLVAVLYVSAGLLVVDEQPSRSPRVSSGTPRAVGWSLVAFGMAAAGAFAVEQVAGDWSALRLSVDLGSPPGKAGLAFVAFAGGMTAGRLGGDAVLGRIGRDRTFLLSSALAFVGLSAAGLANSPSLVYVGFLVGGLGVATFFPTIYDDAAQFPGRPGAALGALTSGSRVAMLAVPTLVGALASTSLSVGQATILVELPALGVLVGARAWLER